MKLTDTAVKKAKPEAKLYKMADGGGMFLLVQLNGGKWWRLKYRFGGKEKLLSFGQVLALTFNPDCPLERNQLYFKAQAS